MKLPSSLEGALPKTLQPRADQSWKRLRGFACEPTGWLCPQTCVHIVRKASRPQNAAPRDGGARKRRRGREDPEPETTPSNTSATNVPAAYTPPRVHESDLTLIAPAPAPVTELKAAASAQRPSTSQSPSADEHDGAPVPLARVAPRRTRSYTQHANKQAKADKGGNKADPIIFGDSDDDDEPSARTSKAGDYCVDVESQEWKPPPPPPDDEVVRIKREREEATQREVNSRWAEKDQRDEQERVRVKRERSDERADSTGDIETTKEVVNVTDELGPPAPFEVTDEQKPCPLCRHCVVIDRARQSSILHCGLGHCKMSCCLAEFCWDCGEVLHHSNGRRATRSSEAAHLAQLGGMGCPKKTWWT